MKKHLIVLTLMAGLFAPNLHAADTAADDPNPNWFSFGPGFGLNIGARFKYLGNVSPAAPGPATGGDVNRTYDDGYVRVDSTGNAGGQTWNWGYHNAPQVQGDTLTMHAASVNGTLDQNADPQAGFDLAYGRHLGTVLGGKWGLQTAFDFMDISIRDNGSFTGTGTLISDAYSLGGVIPPQAPYSGSFNGPGPLLGDSPSRTTASEAVLISGVQKLDAQIYTLRAGPYYELPFGKGWSGRLGGGLALALADSTYSFNETIAFGNGTLLHSAGSNSGADFLAGGYLEGRLLYDFNSRWSVFAGAQYEYLGTLSRTAGGQQAQLDLGEVVYVTFGVELNF
jgi:hypothetical protein